VSAEIDLWKWRNLIASEHGPRDPTTRLVLLTISLHMNERGENAFPSQKLIATRTALSDRCVRAHIEKASQAGWIIVRVKGKTGQGWRINEYLPSVPPSLEVEVPESPWEADKTWKRAERNSAPSSQPSEHRAEPVSSPSSTHACESAGTLLAPRSQNKEGAENGAEGAELHDTTCGTSFQKVRNHVPTNNSYNNPNNISEECALSDETTRAIENDEQSSTKTKPLLRVVRTKRQLSDEDLAAKIEKLRKVTDGSADEMVKILSGGYDGITESRVRDAMSRPTSRGGIGASAAQ